MSEHGMPIDAGGVKSARRALVLLETLSRRGAGLTFSELQEALGYPKGSLHALLRTLTDADWVRLVPQGKVFVLGFRAWEVGAAYSQMVPWQQRAEQIMRNVRDALGETTQLAVLDDFEALYVAKVDGSHMLKLDSSVGQRLEPHATGVGKVLLSGLPDRILGAWLKGRKLRRYTPKTITGHRELRAELAAIRERGYATDAEERTLGACCVAVGIHGRDGDIVAAMSVSAPTVRFTEAAQTRALTALRRASQEMAQAVADFLPVRHETG